MSATVCEIIRIDKHPNADRLELVTVEWDQFDDGSNVKIVTGPHYRVGQLGVYIPPGTVIPGYLAVESWLVGKGKIDLPYTVQSKIMRGIESPGLFMGQWYKKDRKDPRSVQRFADQEAAGMAPNLGRLDYGEEWIKWRYWRDEWTLGQDVSADLDISPRVAQSTERLVLNQRVEALRPSVGSSHAEGA